MSVVYHSHCPLDYCSTGETYVLTTENSLAQDEQCSFNRTGVLCGSCSAGLSSVLGSSACHPCSTNWLLLLIPFASLGIIMVVGLTLLNITIATGTLSGIIFYCNVIGSNVSIFFRGQPITFLTPLLKMFVSLINLETGISLCFFDGMDAYVKGWLNFAFPLYVWVITGVLICLGGRWSWVVKQNAVKVLATLILLSYARLLGAISEALQVSYIHLQNGKFERRWKHSLFPRKAYSPGFICLTIQCITPSFCIVPMFFAVFTKGITSLNIVLGKQVEALL